MNASHLDHPSEESLERFLLKHSTNDELAQAESHILACPTCVWRLKELEGEMAAIKLALQQVASPPKVRLSGSRWRVRYGTFLSSSFSISCVVLFVISLTFNLQHSGNATQSVVITLSANRGEGRPAIAPEGRELSLILGAKDIANGPVAVSIFDAKGNFINREGGSVKNEQVKVTVPKIDCSGHYFVRLYAVGTNHNQDLLLEFPLDVAPTLFRP